MVVINEINTEATVNLLTRALRSRLARRPRGDAWGALSDLEVDEESGEETRKGGTRTTCTSTAQTARSRRFLDDDDPAQAQPDLMRATRTLRLSSEALGAE